MALADATSPSTVSDSAVEATIARVWRSLRAGRSEGGSDDIHRALAANRTAGECLSKGHPDGALCAAEVAVAAFPTWPAGIHAFACALAAFGRLSEAREAFEACLRRDPGYEPAYIALFHLADDAGAHEEALGVLDRLDAAVPGLAESAFLRGSALLRRGDYAGAAKALDRGLQAPVPTPNTRMLPNGVVSEPRLIQDRDQIARLMARGILEADTYRPVLAAYDLILSQFPRHAGSDWTTAPGLRLDQEALSLIRPFYRRTVHLARADRRREGALNPMLDGTAVVSSYTECPGRPAAVIDDLLTPETLETLLAYLHDSTIWHNDAQLGRNYIGAYRQNGLACPLVEQVGEELQARLAPILADHRLLEYWAYRIVTGEAGVGAHADSTAVNVNIWLSPTPADHAGGLVIYDRMAPESWSYADYNANPETIAKFLDGAERWEVPFQQNRAIVFNSRLFHETASVAPAARYEDARINLTFLYGCGLS